MRSKQPRRQRKYRYNAPLHIRQRFLRAPLSEELRKKYGRRNVRVAAGDKVRVMRGKFRKREGEVTKIDLQRVRVLVKGVGRKKVSGAETLVPLDPSKVMITELKTDDPKRMARLKKSETQGEKR